MSLRCYFSNIYDRENCKYDTFVANFQFNLYTMSFIRCGSCYNCKKFQAIQWVEKSKYELYSWKFAYFITLTYNNDNLPLELNTRDYQLFLKRFRIWLHRKYNEKCKYMISGEYGARFSRPHYHMILYCNIDLTDSFYKVAKRQYSSRLIEEMWGLGFITIAPASIETIAYTAFYSTKKLTKKQKFSFLEKYSDNGVVPKSEFIYASNNFGVEYVLKNKDYFMKNWNVLPRSMLRSSIFGEDFVNDVKDLKNYYVYQLHETIDWKKQRLEYYDIEKKQRFLIENKRNMRFK